MKVQRTFLPSKKLTCLHFCEMQKNKYTAWMFTIIFASNSKGAKLPCRAKSGAARK